MRQAIPMTCCLAAACTATAGDPLRLHPGNPHYFLFHGRPTVIVTSGEHYGAVLNRDFDGNRYLKTLEADGMNGTRLFTGAYYEPAGAFHIAKNTLAPAPGRLLCPWARTDMPGCAGGGNKFDLSRWDPAYFSRLKTFIREASKRGIIVEVNLFCPFYGDAQWRLSPMNATNNVNQVGEVGRTRVYTLDRNGGLLQFQEAMVRKIATELRESDNIYYEVMNEPYIRHISMAWQRHMIDVITETEERLGVRHLISLNVANGKARVRAPHPAVSIFNFHYAFPPDTVTINYRLGKVIGDNETGFHGTAPDYYRIEGWAFILAGGGLYNNLDYSFTVGHEDGTFAYPKTQPGSGGRELRRQLRTLKEFIIRFDFVRMTPNPEVVQTPLPDGVHFQALAEPGRQYAVYLYRMPGKTRKTKIRLALDAPPGMYKVQWVHPKSGRMTPGRNVRHVKGLLRLDTPIFEQDLALSATLEPRGE